MYRPNQNKKEESIKLVKIDNNIKGNKRTKKNYHQENMDYLTQIVRNKNIAKVKITISKRNFINLFAIVCLMLFCFVNLSCIVIKYI